MLRVRMAMKTGLILAVWTLTLAGVTVTRAEDCTNCAPAAPSCECNSCTKCPPYVKHFSEGPPKLCFKEACPKPICCPCDLEYYGYYPTCWHRWPWEPNYSHCPAPGCPTVPADKNDNSVYAPGNGQGAMRVYDKGL